MKVERKEEEEQQQQQKQQKQDQKAANANKNDWINKEETKVNRELFNKHFHYQTPSALLKDLYKTNDKEKNSLLVNVVNNGLRDLMEEINKMSKKERQIEKTDKIVTIIKRTLKFNEQQQSGRGLKFLTPNQMRSRLSITLAQLKPGNNSVKLKNEIRQLLYSLYCSKK